MVDGVTGAIYAPAALLYISGNASLASAVVVDELSLSGNAASTQAADAADVSGGDAAGQLLAGNLEVYVDNSGGLFTAEELARIQDAVNAVDAVVEPFGVSVAETTDPTLANVVIDIGSSSTVGGYGDGILGCYNTTGEITLIQGWNWYAGSDPTQIGSNQYDLQTTVTHELGHALGLGESDNPTSAMYGTLSPGTAIRTLTTADLNIPYDEGAADPQRAAQLPAVDAVSGSQTLTFPWIAVNTVNPTVVSAGSTAGWNGNPHLAMPATPLATPSLETILPSSAASGLMPALRFIVAAADIDMQDLMPGDGTSPIWDSADPWTDWLAATRHSLRASLGGNLLPAGQQAGDEKATVQGRDRVFGQMAGNVSGNQEALPISPSQQASDQATLDQCFSQLAATGDQVAEDD